VMFAEWKMVRARGRVGTPCHRSLSAGRERPGRSRGRRARGRLVQGQESGGRICLGN
jgi:hypothetical protein